jgi:hypothetical protein
MHPVPGESAEPTAILPTALAEDLREGSFVAVVSSREEFFRWIDQPSSGLEGLEVEGLLDDPEVWARAAQGPDALPLDVVVRDPAAEFSALYRLVDVRNARPVRVTLPARPGFLKALRLTAALQLPVRLLPGQPDAATVAGLIEAAEFYLYDPGVEVPIEFFHSVIAAFQGMADGTLWDILEQDPAAVACRDTTVGETHAPEFVENRFEELFQEAGGCATCRWQPLCAGYFKWPDAAYDCAGVRRLFAMLESAADEIAGDLANPDLSAS